LGIQLNTLAYSWARPCVVRVPFVMIFSCRPPLLLHSCIVRATTVAGHCFKINHADSARQILVLDAHLFAVVVSFAFVNQFFSQDSEREVGTLFLPKRSCVRSAGTGG
jgi:hypothetical protein